MSILINTKVTRLNSDSNESCLRILSLVCPETEQYCVFIVAVCPETEETLYTDQFFESQDLVVNALDNVEARRYMDR